MEFSELSEIEQSAESDDETSGDRDSENHNVNNAGDNQRYALPWFRVHDNMQINLYNLHK